MSQRRRTTTLVMIARARPPYRPLDLSAMSGRLVEYRTLSAVDADREDGDRDPVDPRLEAPARIGQDQGEQDDRGGVLERERELVDDRDRRRR